MSKEMTPQERINNDSDCALTLLKEFDLYSQGNIDYIGSPFRVRVLKLIKEYKNNNAKIVMDFANMHVGAFEAGFTSNNTLTIYDLHRTAQNYVRDTFQVNVKSLDEEWGELTSKECRYNDCK